MKSDYVVVLEYVVLLVALVPLVCAGVAVVVVVVVCVVIVATAAVKSFEFFFFLLMFSKRLFLDRVSSRVLQHCTRRQTRVEILTCWKPVYHSVTGVENACHYTEGADTLVYM